MKQYRLTFIRPCGRIRTISAIGYSKTQAALMACKRNGIAPSAVTKIREA